MKFVEQVLETSPNKPRDMDKLMQAISSLSDCAASCNACADACLSEDNVQQLSKCIKLLMDCATVCQSGASVLSRPTFTDQAFLEAQLQACSDICRACGSECRQHAQHHEHCRACADACDNCMSVCQNLLGSISSIAAAA